MDATTKREIIEHLANTAGYDGEVLEEHEITPRKLRAIMATADFDKCSCGRWTHAEATCICAHYE